MDDKIQENQTEEKDVKKKGPLAIEFFPNQMVWEKAVVIARDKRSRVDELSTCVSQDPILVLELLKISNALYFSPGSTPITSAKTAIVRLGSDAVLECLQSFGEREKLEDEDASAWLETYRSKAKRTSIVASILAQSLASNLREDCQTAGLFVSIGEMLAVAFLKERFVDLANNKSPATLPYHLTQQLSFDPEKIGLNYLRHSGIPEILIFPIDRDSRPPQAALTIMRPLIMSSRELVDAFDQDRWEKLAPGQKLSAKSNLKLLQISDSQYLKIYERVAEYLFSEKLAEARRENLSNAEIHETELEVFQDEQLIDEQVQDLDNEIENLLNDFDNFQEIESVQEQESQEEELTETAIEETSFSLQSDLNDLIKSHPQIEEPKPEFIEPPKFRSEGGRRVMDSVMKLVDEVQSSEELLDGILKHLVKNGPFKKTALIVVSDTRQSAKVVAAQGLNVKSGQILNLDDPLSPLANCFSKIQSYGNQPNKNSPFGSKAFAVSPINAEHPNPVALYADCGDGSISLEGRRVFRTVVDMLNKVLPTIPGGIPGDFID